MLLLFLIKNKKNVHFFFIGNQRNSIKKALGAPKHIGKYTRRKPKQKEKHKTKEEHPQNPKRQKKPPILPQMCAHVSPSLICSVPPTTK
jgi:hypothetical protein